MRFVRFSVRQALQGLWRNRVMNIAATVTMVLMLILLSTLVILISGVEAGLAFIESKVEVRAELHDGLRAESVSEFQQRLGALPEVASTTYVSKEQALADFQAARAEQGRQRPDQLSGGEMQRTAIARAMVHDPRLIIADEPTGNLDPLISWEIIQLLLRINEMGTTVMMATHDAEVVTALRRRVVALEDGRIVRDEVGGYHREY